MLFTELSRSLDRQPPQVRRLARLLPVSLVALWCVYPIARAQSRLDDPAYADDHGTGADGERHGDALTPRVANGQPHGPAVAVGTARRSAP